MHSIPATAVSGVKVFDGDGRPHMRYVILLDLPLPIPVDFGGTTFYFGEELDASVSSTSTTPLPPFRHLLPEIRIKLRN